MTRQNRRQLDSASMSCNSLIVDINNDICSHQQANMLAAHASTIHQYTWFQVQCKHLIALLDTSVMHLHFEYSHLKTLDYRVKLYEIFNSRVGGYT
jgi:hypothetical protein